MKRVYAVQDNDCHWYVIPFERKAEFFIDLESGDNDEWKYFNEIWSEFTTGGDLNNIQLYAES
jgi:hypothetical protein